MSTFHPTEKLVHLIEWKRKEMIDSAHQTGLSSLQTLTKSIELDHLLNLHQQASTKNSDLKLEISV
ncbi:Spo0E family sporulation regulatory protein-aspartic acid phosphatase [Cytobacillus sp. FJAT-54145]|uniref:Spo0E family sporulation regulatory protein-aspartic acid phosphatase n=1 Tax=Cytobacillus spartinae TaxID=3299023 RepID=A0ABW6KIK3_9BACI